MQLILFIVLLIFFHYYCLWFNLACCSVVVVVVVVVVGSCLLFWLILLIPFVDFCCTPLFCLLFVDFSSRYYLLFLLQLPIVCSLLLTLWFSVDRFQVHMKLINYY